MDPVVPELITQLFENALLIEGLHPNPAEMVSRIQAIMAAAAGTSPALDAAGAAAGAGPASDAAGAAAGADPASDAATERDPAPDAD
jgi:hypothetical protein